MMSSVVQEMCAEDDLEIEHSSRECGSVTPSSIHSHFLTYKAVLDLV